MNEPQIVAAKEADIRAMAARRWPDEVSRQLYVNLAATAPRSAWVARDADDTPVGIAFAHEMDTEWFISELFVEPSFRGARLGWQLLRTATADSGDVSLAGLAEANDLGSLTFFLRRGAGLQVPVLRVSGEIPREEDLMQLAAGDYRFDAVTLDPRAHGGALDELDREVRGTARPKDHEGFVQLATGTSFFLHDELVGYTYVWADGRIGPMVAASSAYLIQFLGFAMMSLQRAYAAKWCMALVPGSNTRIMRNSIRLGLTLDQPRIFATDQPQIDLSRYIGFHPLAF
jgi:GNAT superfamily N-acetyltransferase